MTLDLERLLTWCQAELAWQVSTIEALARIESPSHDKAAVDRCGAELARRLQEIGGKVTLIPSDAGDHVRAEFGGAGEAARTAADCAPTIAIRSCCSGTSIRSGRSARSNGCRSSRRTAASTAPARST